MRQTTEHNDRGWNAIMKEAAVKLITVLRDAAERLHYSVRVR